MLKSTALPLVFGNREVWVISHSNDNPFFHPTPKRDDCHPKDAGSLPHHEWSIAC